MRVVGIEVITEATTENMNTNEVSCNEELRLSTDHDHSNLLTDVTVEESRLTYDDLADNIF